MGKEGASWEGRWELGRAEAGVSTRWDLADGNDLCYANEQKNEASCLDQKPELSGRSPKGVVQLETEKFIASGLEQNRIFIRLSPGGR